MRIFFLNISHCVLVGWASEVSNILLNRDNESNVRMCVGKCVFLYSLPCRSHVKGSSLCGTSGYWSASVWGMTQRLTRSGTDTLGSPTFTPSLTVRSVLNPTLVPSVVRELLRRINSFWSQNSGVGQRNLHRSLILGRVVRVWSELYTQGGSDDTQS